MRYLAPCLLTLVLSACTSVPPAPTAPAAVPQAQGTAIPMINPSFTPNASGHMTGWTRIEHARGNSYTFVADPEQAYSAPVSARIRRHGVEFYGLMEQRIKVEPAWRGKTARLSGYLKTQGATGTGGALVIKSLDGGGNILVHDFMNDRRVRGDQGWKRYQAEVKIAPDSYYLRVGVMLEDDGTLWADDLSLELVD